MSRSRLVCNLGLSDFFTLPDSGNVWRKKGGDKTYLDKDGKQTAGYVCENLYDSDEMTFRLRVKWLFRSLHTFPLNIP